MKLVFVMSLNMSLGKWHELGLLERESKFLADVGMFDYICEGVLHNASRRSHDLIPVITLSGLFRLLFTSRQSFLLVTNQDSSLFFSLLILLVFSRRVRLVYRSGYDQAFFFRQEGKIFREKIFAFLSYLGESLCQVRITSWEHTNASDSRAHNFVIPNSEAKTALFSEREGRQWEMIHVGRNSQQKRSKLCRKVLSNYKSILVSDSVPLSEALPENVTCYSKIPNDEVLRLMGRTKYLLLLSKYEGSPKVLIEAVMQGCIPVLSENVIQILPGALQPYFIPAMVTRSRVVNLREIEESFLIGADAVADYYSREKCAEKWRAALKHAL